MQYRNMASPDEQEETNPLVQPRVIRTLKDRPRLIDLGFRQEVLEQMESAMARRRSPDVIAERATQEVKQTAEEATEPVVRDRLRSRVEKANNGILNKL